MIRIGDYTVTTQPKVDHQSVQHSSKSYKKVIHRAGARGIIGEI